MSNIALYPIRVNIKYTDDRMSAAIIFYQVTNMVIERTDDALITERISKATFISRIKNSLYSDTSSIILDRHSSEGEEIEIDYDETR